MKVQLVLLLLSFTFIPFDHYSQNIVQLTEVDCSVNLESELFSISKANNLYNLKNQIKNSIDKSQLNQQMLILTPDKKGCGVSVVYWALAGALLGTVAALLTPNDPFWPPVSIGAGIGIIAWIVTCSSSGDR